jgi:arylsulfatase A-like enzyme
MTMDAQRRSYAEGSAFNGVIGRTVAESVPAWPEPVRPADGAPNVVVVLLDDVGFADFGCFGSSIDTPTFDALAANGLRYGQFHTTALCTPSRASLLTGRNHHANGSGWLPSSPLGFPGYDARIPRENGFLSETLRAQGYATFAIGKWHLTPYSEMAAGSTRARWPLARGFDRFYGFMGGFTSQWVPDLVYDNHHVAPPRTPEEGYHLNDDLASRAIEFVSDLRTVEPSRPFLLYYCPAACHHPHHVPREWADRYAGRFDHGWDRLRDEVFARQLELGVVPEGTTLSPRPEGIPPWDAIDAGERPFYARQMEVYAGLLEHTDHHVGRVMSFLDAIGELDNTLLLVGSDNGADGSDPTGSMIRRQPRDTTIPLEEWGSVRTHPSYCRAWAWVGNTPCREWKRNVHEGGVKDPLVVHWPAGIEARGEVRQQYAHITDIAPTVLDLLGIEPPPVLDGVTQSPLHGVSFAHTIEDGEAPTAKQVQYYEMTGSRAIWAEGWKAVADHPDDVPMNQEALAGQRWELFDATKDVSESHDLSTKDPARLARLVEQWWTEAGRYGVLPLHAHQAHGRRLQSPDVLEDRRQPSRFVFYPGAAPVLAARAPRLDNRSHRITAHIENSGGQSEGVVLAHGDDLHGGYALYVRDGRVHYVHHHPESGEERVSSDAPLPSGPVTVTVTVTVEAGDVAGSVVLAVDGTTAATGALTRPLHPLYGVFDAGLCCGYDRGQVVTRDYRPPFRFTGVITDVVVELDAT